MSDDASFSQRIRKLKPAAGKRLWAYDDQVPGLALRVSPTSANWSFVYRPKNGGAQRRMTYGPYPMTTITQARAWAGELKLRVLRGEDPAAEADAHKAKPKGMTVTALVERYLRDYARKEIKTANEYEAVLKRNALPVFGMKPAADLRRLDITDMLDAVAARSGSAANRTQAMLSSVYAWAVDKGLLEVNPCHGIRQRHVEKARERVLADAEIAKLWRVTETAPAFVRDALRLSLLTLARPGEAVGIRAEHVDLKAAMWRLPGDHTKNEHPHDVPLVGEALAIVRRLVEAGPKRGCLMKTTSGLDPDDQNLAQAVKRVLAAHWPENRPTARDMRRTAATKLQSMGVQIIVIGWLQNHEETKRATVTTGTYARYDYMPERIDALTKLDAEIRRLITNA